MKATTIIIIAIIIAVISIAGILLIPEKTPKTGNFVSGLSVRDIYECDDAKCMDGVTENLLKEKSAKELLLELEEIGKEDSDVLYYCHPITHSIGRMLYKKLSEENKHLGDVFQECDHTCHSGCFHGAMERVFQLDTTDTHLIKSTLEEKVPKVCKVFEYGEYGNIKFQCLHGIGHAVMFFLDYNLTESLKLCDLLPSSWDQSSCYGGAFMENIFASNKTKRWLTNDPHFPCNAIDDKYRQDCYIMQTSRMFELGLLPEQIGKECEKAGDYRYQCIQSLGRDVSNDARLNPNNAPVCTKLSTSRDKEFCIAGLVYSLTDNSWDGKYAFPYCDTLPDDLKEYCYKTAISYLINSIYITKQVVTSSCENYSSYPECKSIVSTS